MNSKCNSKAGRGASSQSFTHTHTHKKTSKQTDKQNLRKAGTITPARTYYPRFQNCKRKPFQSLQDSVPERQFKGCSHERAQKYLQEHAQEKVFISGLLSLKFSSSLIKLLDLWKHKKLSLPSWQLLALMPGKAACALSRTTCQDERQATLQQFTCMSLNIWRANEIQFGANITTPTPQLELRFTFFVLTFIPLYFNYLVTSLSPTWV